MAFIDESVAIDFIIVESCCIDFIAAESRADIAFIIESCAAADIIALSRIPGMARAAESLVTGIAIPLMSLLTGTSRSGDAAVRVAGAFFGSDVVAWVAGFGGAFLGGVAVFVAAGLGAGVAGIFMPGML